MWQKLKAGDKVYAINIDKCIACGACAYACPFGAIMDKSFMVDAINIIKNLPLPSLVIACFGQALMQRCEIQPRQDGLTV